jgi:hypothetical protein
MKTLISFLTMIIFSVLIYSCQKEDPNIKSDNLNETNNVTNLEWVNPKDPVLPHILWPKFYVGKGTQPPGSTCGLSLPCGPCSGICVKISWRVTNEGSPGSGEVEVLPTLVNDTTLHVIFLGGGIDDGEGNSFVEATHNIGVDASEVFEKDSILIRIGTYPISYEREEYGEVYYKVACY